jgi:hypothetical protein
MIKNGCFWGQKYILNAFHCGGSLEMQVLEQIRANVQMHFWWAGVHVRQPVVWSEGQYQPGAVPQAGSPE